MIIHGSVQPTILPALAAPLILVAGCAGGGAGPGVSGGVYAGTYEVPTVSAELAAAAVFAVPEVEWTRTGDAAELSYDLPLALVGKPVRVRFEGAFAGELTGVAGTATCSAAGSEVSCHEVMQGLLPLAPDLAVVEQLAADYAGPASHRLEVATIFAADPIGVVRLDTASPTGAHPEVEPD